VGPGRAVARGTGRGLQLPVRIPSNTPTGLYLLRVVAAGHRATQPVVVQGAHKGKVLVVLPAIAWQGGNPVDDDADGFPNTLTGGEAFGASVIGVEHPGALQRQHRGDRSELDLALDAAAHDGGGPRLRAGQELRGHRRGRARPQRRHEHLGLAAQTDDPLADPVEDFSGVG